MRFRASVFAIVTLCLAALPVVAGQRTVKVSTSWVKLPAEGAAETAAFVTVENGTMYDVYLVGVESDAAAVVELRQASKSGGAPTPAKEVAVPAFDRLDMAPDGVYVHLGQLKRPLKAGDRVSLTISVDSGTPLAVEATVK
jgi:periplasmic copper chaperone A